MKTLLGEQVDEIATLDISLRELTLGGFIEKEGCYFLKNVSPQNHYSLNDFDNRTSYECFVNSLHIDDYVSEDYLNQACLMLDEIFLQWKLLHNDIQLKGIVSKTEFGANLKFHCLRPREFWINESDIEKFDEAIMIRVSCETFNT